MVLETLGLLRDLAHTARLEAAIGPMFAGERINVTEGRAVLHTPCAIAARRPSS
jgi:glucose-6-phosphate isomerase